MEFWACVALKSTFPVLELVGPETWCHGVLGLCRFSYMFFRASGEAILGTLKYVFNALF